MHTECVYAKVVGGLLGRSLPSDQEKLDENHSSRPSIVHAFSFAAWFFFTKSSKKKGLGTPSQFHTERQETLGDGPDHTNVAPNPVDLH